MSPITLPAVGLVLLVVFQALAAYLDWRVTRETGHLEAQR